MYNKKCCYVDRLLSSTKIQLVPADRSLLLFMEKARGHLFCIEEDAFCNPLPLEEILGWVKAAGGLLPARVCGDADDAEIVLFEPRSKYMLPECEVRIGKTCNGVFINGEDRGSLHTHVAHEAYNDKGSMCAESVKSFSDAGIQTFSILYFPHVFWRSLNQFDEEAAWDHLEGVFLSILREAPKANFIIRWSLFSPAWWAEKFPDDTVQFSDNVDRISNMPNDASPPSYASEKWRTAQMEIMEKILAHLRKSPLASRLIGIRLAYANCGEWNNVGYHEHTFPDYSPVMLDAYTSWVKAKYETVELLSEAWSCEIPSFDLVGIPSKEERMETASDGRRPETIRKKVADYYEFWQNITVETIEYFATRLKKLTEGRILIGAFYGYYLGHLPQGPFHSVDSGHYGLAQCLKSDAIDFVGGPYPYTNRRESAPINGAYSSTRLHGKIWDTENDQRTNLSGEENRIYGTTDSVQESIAIAVRDFACNVTKGCHMYYYDFALGWFLEREFMATIRKLREIDLSLDDTRHPQAEVAVFLSEKAVIEKSNSAPWMAVTEQFLRTTMDSAGAPWDCYLLSDLAAIPVEQYKIFLFPSFSTSEADPNLLHKLVERGITIIFMDGLDLETSKSCATTSDTGAGASIFQPIDRVGVEKLRDLYDIAGVHVYSRNDGLFFGGRGLVCLYVRNPGNYEIEFPTPVSKAYDALSGAVIAERSERVQLINADGCQSFLIRLENPK